MSTWTRIALVVAASQGEDNLPRVAEAFGYRRESLISDREDLSSKPDNIPAESDQSITPLQQPSPAGVRSRKLRIWRLEQRRTRESELVTSPPAYLSDPRLILASDDPLMGDFRFPFPKPLVPQRRLRPFLLNALGRATATGMIDTGKIMRSWSAGRVLRRLPCRLRQRWPRRLRIIADTSEYLRPCRHDFQRLCENFRHELGKGSVTAMRFTGKIGAECLDWFDQAALPGPCREPDSNTAVLVLSDLGVMARDSNSMREWRDLALRFYRSGISPVTLSPATNAPRDRFICRLFRPQRFDSGIALPKRPGNRGFQAKPVGIHEFDRLLRLVAPWPLIDPGLLRAIRKLIPGLSAAAEARLWSHAGARTDSLGLRLNAEHRDRYLSNEGLDEAGKQLVRDRLARTYRLVLDQHRDGPLPLRYIEGLIADSLGLSTESITQELKKLLVTAYQNRNSARGARFGSFLSAACDLLPETAWEGAYREIIHTMFAVGHFDQLNTGNFQLPLPERLDSNQIAWAFPEARGAAREPIRFCQVDGTRLLLQRRSDGDFLTDSIATNVIAKAESSGFQPIQYSVRSERDGNEIKGLISHGSSIPCGVHRVVVRTDVEEFEFSADPCPPWASALGRDERGLFAINRFDGRRLEWCEPGFVTLKEPHGPEIARWRFEKGFWHDSQSGGADGIELVRPDWASEFGADSIGVYADFEVDRVVQRLRWIMPGMFVMGSPSNEHGRLDRETRHDVILSQGFWLADTACTQALWTAVMGKNPSRFKGKDRPVEKVSCYNVEDFLAVLNQRVPGLNATLPSEAQWEYACRAGTVTPFSFGDTINTEQANFDGNYPYRDQDPKGEYREQTVDVKALPQNPWGLYQMHGNVWEWCRDGLREYTTASVVDPLGPEGDKPRVARGGSWDDYAWFLRCAYRFHWHRSSRDVFLGFRLSRGPELQASAAEPLKKNQQEERRAETARSRAQILPEPGKGLIERLRDRFLGGKDASDTEEKP